MYKLTTLIILLKPDSFGLCIFMILYYVFCRFCLLHIFRPQCSHSDKVLFEASSVSSSYNSVQPLGGVSEQQAGKGSKLAEREKKKSEDKAKR